VRPYAAEHLGSVYVEQGRFREAVEMYEEAIAFCRHTDTRHLLDQIPLLKQLEATAHQKYDAQRREAAARGMESTLGVATVCVDRTASRHSRKAPQVEVAIGVPMMQAEELQMPLVMTLPNLSSKEPKCPCEPAGQRLLFSGPSRRLTLAG
jgi:hypothetical protein